MINVGILGAGRSGLELHAGPLQHIDGFRVTAIADITPARQAFAAKTFHVKTYGDPAELIADSNVDLVVVALPNSMHARYTLAALAAGKHVICEKPMTTTLADADAMLEAAERAKRRLVVFHNRHWDTDYQMVKQAVADGLLGGLLSVESRVMSYGPEWLTFGVPEFRPSWRIEAAYGGGFLFDWGTHVLEQILDLTGEWPRTVTCHLRSGMWATETDDYYDLKLVMPSGLLVSVIGTNDARAPLPRWYVIGHDGTLVADGAWGHWAEMRVRKSDGDTLVDVTPRGTGPTSKARSMEVSNTLSNGFYSDLREALATGRSPEVPATRGRDAVAIIEAARRSASSGRPIKPAAPRYAYGAATQK